MTTDNFRFYLLDRLIQTSQTEGQQYSDTSPFSIPCCNHYILSVGEQEQESFTVKYMSKLAQYIFFN